MGLQDDRRDRYEQLFALSYVPLQRYLLRRTDPSTAEDVLGDVMLVLWRRLDDVPGEAPLAWAYGVARGCLANSRRSSARREQLVQRLAAEPVATAAPDDPAIDAALAALPDGDRELLRLWAWEQLPPREIALVLGISANAASIRLHRATRKLARLLGGRKDSAAPGQLAGRQGEEAPR